MGIIQEFLAKRKADKEANREFERSARAQENFYTKRMNSDERELRGYKEQERRAQIKRELEYYRRVKSEKMRTDSSAYNSPNIFTGHKNLLEQPKIFSVGNVIEKEKNIFFHGG